MWWPQTSTNGEIYLRFLNVATATSLVHFWAFWLICVTKIRQLRADIPSLDALDILILGHAPESEQITQDIIRLASSILQSVGFFVHDRMKIFGVAEISFPYLTATKVLAGAV